MLPARLRELKSRYPALVVTFHDPVGTGSGHVIFLERTDGQDLEGYDALGRKVKLAIAKLTLERVVDHDYMFGEDGHLLIHRMEDKEEQWKDLGPWKEFDPSYTLPSKKPKGLRSSTKSGINMEDMGLD